MLLLLLVLVLPLFFQTIFNRSNPDSAFYNENGFIQVTGDVPLPGVYHLYSPSNIISILNKAAGLSELDDLSQSIPSTAIRSGMKISVLREGKIWRFRNEEMSAFYKFTLGIPISLNQESEEGLTAIPGIGPQLAKTIVQERDKRGRFHSLNEFMSVKGIGPRLIKRIGAYVTF